MSSFTKGDTTPRFRMTLAVLATLFAGSLLVPGPSAQARPNYKGVFSKKYEKKLDAKLRGCTACHEKKADGKTNTKKRNNYGTAVGKLLGKKKAKNPAVEEAITKAEKEPSAIKGKTFGDLIDEGKAPSTQPEKKDK